MSANLCISVIDNRVAQNGGLVWCRLHSEREEICEALLQEVHLTSAQLHDSALSEEIIQTANWHRELLQARLCKIDDALDRLMSGSYGICSKCGRWIDDTKLDFDATTAVCGECGNGSKIKQ